MQKQNKTKPIPDAVQKTLHAFNDPPSFNKDFNYHSVVGKLKYITQTTWPNIIYVVHKCASFSADPHKEHGETIVYLVKYLKTHHLGIKSTPNQS